MRPPSDHDLAAPAGGAFDEARDATRRTRLANERTLLAWSRSGLTALAVALATGKVVPDLAHHATRWPYAVVGVGYALLGVAYIGYGYLRQREVEAALRAGRYAHADAGVVAVLTGVAVALGLLTALLLIINP
jgi:putative membrane protein